MLDETDAGGDAETEAAVVEEVGELVEELAESGATAEGAAAAGAAAAGAAAEGAAAADSAGPPGADA